MLWAFVLTATACGQEGSSLLLPSPTLIYTTPTPVIRSGRVIDTPLNLSIEPPMPTRTAVPTPVPTQIQSGVSAASAPSSNQDIITEISKYSWPIDQAIAVATCESGFKTTAYNPSGATGLFQIMNGSFDLKENVAAAFSKYQSGVAIGNAWYHWNQFGDCGHF